MRVEKRVLLGSAHCIADAGLMLSSRLNLRAKEKIGEEFWGPISVVRRSLNMHACRSSPTQPTLIYNHRIDGYLRMKAEKSASPWPRKQSRSYCRRLEDGSGNTKEIRGNYAWSSGAPPMSSCTRATEQSLVVTEPRGKRWASIGPNGPID